MQEVGRIGAAVDLQLIVGGLERLAQREHAAFGRQVITLQQIALLAGGQDVFPCGGAATGFGNKVVEGQFVRFMLLAAVLAGPFVAQEYVKPRKGRPCFRLHIFFKGNYAWHLHLKARRVDHFIVFGDDADAIEEYSFDRFLP